MESERSGDDQDGVKTLYLMLACLSDVHFLVERLSQLLIDVPRTTTEWSLNPHRCFFQKSPVTHTNNILTTLLIRSPEQRPFNSEANGTDL